MNNNTLLATATLLLQVFGYPGVLLIGDATQEVSSFAEHTLNPLKQMPTKRIKALSSKAWFEAGCLFEMLGEYGSARPFLSSGKGSAFLFNQGTFPVLSLVTELPEECNNFLIGILMAAHISDLHLVGVGWNTSAHNQALSTYTQKARAAQINLVGKHALRSNAPALTFMLRPLDNAKCKNIIAREAITHLWGRAHIINENIWAMTNEDGLVGDRVHFGVEFC